MKRTAGSLTFAPFNLWPRYSNRVTSPKSVTTNVDTSRVCLQSGNDRNPVEVERGGGGALFQNKHLLKRHLYSPMKIKYLTLQITAWMNGSKICYFCQVSFPFSILFVLLLSSFIVIDYAEFPVLRPHTQAARNTQAWHASLSRHCITIAVAMIADMISYFRVRVGCITG